MVDIYLRQTIIVDIDHVKITIVIYIINFKINVMIKKITVLSLLCICGNILISCSNQIEANTSEVFSTKTSQQFVYLGGQKVEIKEGTLCFQSKNDVITLAKNLKSIAIFSELTRNIGRTNLTQVSELRKAGIISMYDTFVEAMTEAEFYYEKEGGYEEFKKKYSTLFFPEVGSDYSAYLPIMDKQLAKLADKNGDILINDEKVSFIDITGYQQLVALGQTPSEVEQENSIQTRTDYWVNKIPEQKNGGDKVWVNTKAENDGFIPIIRVEVCFRKKNFLGVWYNHNSGTSCKKSGHGGLDPYGKTHFEEFGFSSHDYLYAVVSLDGKHTVPVEQDMIITHGGTGYTLKLRCSYPIRLVS